MFEVWQFLETCFSLRMLLVSQKRGISQALQAFWPTHEDLGLEICRDVIGQAHASDVTAGQDSSSFAGIRIIWGKSCSVSLSATVLQDCLMLNWHVRMLRCE